ncbi:MAG: class I SAM-dependent methyltransferase [Actinomycetota bacterium]
MYAPILPRLKEALQALDCHDIVDLCSGGTGPVLLIQEQLNNREGYPVRVTLSDKFPHLEVLEQAAKGASCEVTFIAEPVDATRVPEGLRGFRTLFASFHHFKPEDARSILEDAARKGEGIGVFEFTGRNPGILLIMLLSPLYLLLFMPFIKPFSWQRIFWTYIIPLAPLVVLWEGMATNMRTYSPQELRELVEDIAENGYTWDIGMVRGTWDLGRVHGIGLHKITYLLGYPSGRVRGA